MQENILTVFKVNSSVYNSWETRYLLIFCGSPLAASCHYSNSSHKKHRGNHSTSKIDSASFVTENCACCFIPSGRGRFLQRSDESHVVFPSRTKLICADCLLILQGEHRPVTMGLIDLQQFITVIRDPKRKFSHLDWKSYHIKWFSSL